MIHFAVFADSVLLAPAAAAVDMIAIAIAMAETSAAVHSLIHIWPDRDSHTESEVAMTLPAA